eukprot:UN27829
MGIKRLLLVDTNVVFYRGLFVGRGNEETRRRLYIQNGKHFPKETETSILHTFAWHLFSIMDHFKPTHCVAACDVRHSEVPLKGRKNIQNTK